MLLWLEIKIFKKMFRDEASLKTDCDDRNVNDRMTLNLMLGKWVVRWKVSETSPVRFSFPVWNFSNDKCAVEAPSLHSDIYHYVINRNLLEFIFNTR
jgi:hypothetical protein